MVRGGLFSRYFLEDGIRQTDAHRALDPAQVAAFGAAALGLWRKLADMGRPSEAETEAEFIFPILALLGWQHLPQQEPGRGRRDIADALLFLSLEAKDRARRLQGSERFRLGAVVVENEARDTPLDRASGAAEAPSSQILRYLARAESQSGGAVQWGLLTSGRYWRLYWAQAPARAEGFIELDLAGLIGAMPPASPDGAPPDHWLRCFLLLFRVAALATAGPERHHFLDHALAEGRHYQERATAALSEAVFCACSQNCCGPSPPTTRARIDDANWRDAAREAALRLLYRLLFLLYAEDRDLLPVRHAGYRAYSLQQLRGEAARVADGAVPLSARAATWWPKLRALFLAIADGDAGMGLPPYDGTLFCDAPGSLLTRVSLPDAVLAPLLDAMSREGGAGARRWINYRDLSVQHLGSIYEQLLERDLVADGAGSVTLRPNPFARKVSGSYYTPEELVRLILRRAEGPLLAERRAAFAARAAELAGDRGAKADRLDLLRPLDPAEAFLRLRICDPAMGSGHFLVSLVDYLADETLSAVTEAPAIVGWAEYRSPLMARVEAIRAQIPAHAAACGWTVAEDQLDDRHVIRRIILKRCVYGVDLNPMAVELAKLALWLHSFTVGAPLSFLDHHLRCGDSLFGEFTGTVERDLRAQFGLVMSGAVVAARNAAAGMALVEEQTDADIAGVEASAAAFAAVEQDTAPLRAFLDLYHAARWLPAETPAARAGRDILFGGGYGDPVELAGGAVAFRSPREAAALRGRGNRAPIPAAEASGAAVMFVADARALARERRFLHWEAAFPGVWDDWEREQSPGGFDAVIGNPPWDRMKMQEVEWFAARAPEIARAERAADRASLIQNLRAEGDPLAAQYDAASSIAERSMAIARSCGCNRCCRTATSTSMHYLSSVRHGSPTATASLPC